MARYIAAAILRTAQSGLAARRLPTEDTRLAIASGLLVLGAALAFNIKGISSVMLRNSSGFTPWGRKRQRPLRPNPARLVGVFFLIFGLIALISVAANP
jgi:hypothetical protein